MPVLAMGCGFGFGLISFVCFFCFFCMCQNEKGVGEVVV